MTISVPSMNRLSAAEHGITIADFLVPIRLGERIGSRARHVVLVLAGALLIALCAQISIRLPDNPVPITGQTLGVLLVGGALGFRRGFLATALYVVLGFFLPVYAEHSSGVERILAVRDGGLVLGATGGYLLGFALAGAVVGRLAELGWDRKVGGALAAMAIGNLLVYAIGLPWLMAATGMPIVTAIEKGALPFLPGDVLKLAVAAGLFPIAWWVVGRRPGER